MCRWRCWKLTCLRTCADLRLAHLHAHLFVRLARLHAHLFIPYFFHSYPPQGFSVYQLSKLAKVYISSFSARQVSDIIMISNLHWSNSATKSRKRSSLWMRCIFLAITCKEINSAQSPLEGTASFVVPPVPGATLPQSCHCPVRHPYSISAMNPSKASRTLVSGTASFNHSTTKSSDTLAVGISFPFTLVITRNIL